MLNKKLSFLAILAAVLFAACGEDVVQNRIGISEMLAVESVSALPECSAENEGEVARVSGELSTFVCTGEKWARTVEDVVVSPELSCASEPLADNSGVKIVCNGDSVAVLKNGKDGEQGLQGKKGEDAAGCSYKYYGKDETLVVTCGETSVTIDLEKKIEEESSSSAPVSSSDVIPVSSSSDVVASSASEESSSSVDEEAIPTSLDSLSGLSQKGPFTKGSTVELYELSDGRTLRQTNGNFLGSIDSDDGFFRINSRNLVSQYAMLVATGTYRNEVTGTTEDAKLALQAITDVSSRSTANVNLLTHLEFARVQYLVTEKKMKVKAAKRQAQAEILNAFHIDTTGTGIKSSEDLSVFGDGNGNAALLAISVLLQGHRSVSELTELLAKISLDFKEDGSWDDAKIRAEVADWAEFWDLADELKAVRKFVKAWNLGVVPEFEVYVRNFYVKEYQIEGECNASNEGKTAQNMNAFSSKKGKQYVCDGSRWIYGFKDARDGRYYRMVNIGDQVWMAENLKYEYQIKKASKDSLLSWSLKMLDKYSSYDTSDIKMREGFVYSWAAAMDSAALFSEDGKGCGRFAECTPAETVRGVCPEGWHLPSEEEFTVLAEYVDYATGKLQYYGTEVYKSYLVGANELGFSAIGASCMVELFMGGFDDCMFDESGWWSSTATREFSGPRASWKEYEEKEPTVFYIGGSLITIAAWYIKEDGLSVRCIKDSE